MKIKLNIVIHLILFIFLFAIPSFAETYYVDVNAVLSSEDGTKENPFLKIQKAADIVKPGDTVLVAPGIYYESVTLKKSGTKENPIIFRSLDSGENKTIITCANRDIREKKVSWSLEDKELQLYSIPYERNVSGMLYNGARMLGYTSLEELKVFECWEGLREAAGTTEGYHHGFWWDSEAKKLYVRLNPEEKYGSINPNNNLMCVGGPYYESVLVNGVEDGAYRKSGISTDSYNFGIITENSANVILHGFTFETPGWCGVFVRASDVTVSNCWFKGCITGVMGGRYSMHDDFWSENVTVEYCDWNLWPTFEDAIDKVKQPSQKFPYQYYWWAVKATDRSLMDYEAGSFCAQAGRNWTIRNNHAYSCLDIFSWALSDGPFVPYIGSNIIPESADGIVMYENRFERALDNAIEFENHAKNVEVYDNEFVNNFIPISWQPLDGTPWPTNLSVHHNVFYVDEEYTELFWTKGNFPLKWLKIGVRDSQWGRNLMANEAFDTDKGQPVKPIVLQDKGYKIYNNTVWLPKGYLSENTGLTVGVDQEFNNTTVFNNLIYCFCQTQEKPFRGRILPGEFATYVPNDQGWRLENNIFIASNPKETTIVDNPVGGTGYYYMEDAGVEKIGEVMYLKEDSPACGGGVQIKEERRDTTDIGAVPYGEKWHINYAPYPYGDVNCDKTVDLTDVMITAENHGMTSEEKEKFNSRCDLDFNGVIDESDLKLLSELYIN